MSNTNWKLVAQEAEKVRDLALEAKAAAELARVKAEQERDAIAARMEDILYTRNLRLNAVEHELSKERQWARLWKRAATWLRCRERCADGCADDMEHERDQARERAANMAVDLTAMTLSRDQALREALRKIARLRRQAAYWKAKAKAGREGIR